MKINEKQHITKQGLVKKNPPKTKEKLYVLTWNDIPLLYNEEEIKFLAKNFSDPGTFNLSNPATKKDEEDNVRGRVSDIVSGKIDDNPEAYYPTSWRDEK